MRRITVPAVVLGPPTGAVPSVRERGSSMIAWLLCLLGGCAVTAEPARLADAEIREQVLATERAFARSMAERDLQAFESFLAEEAIFFAGTNPLRGRQAVVSAWRRFFDGAQAPFSWEPREVEVLATGGLALSSGPVRDAAGNLIATFTSIWRREPSGAWRIVFDKGSEACRCASTGSGAAAPGRPPQ